jgi:tetratricopeptide (TPR) repeat protein
MLGQFDRKFYIDFLRDIDEAEMSGILRLRQGRTIKALFFESGCLVFGISNLPDEELGQHLVNVGILSNEHFSSLQPHINRAQPLTFLLQAYNLVTYEQLVRTEHELVEGMAISCFRWETGEYSFDSSKTADHEFKTQVRSLDILANGIRNLLDDYYVRSVIGEHTQYVLPVTELFNRTKRINLSPQEGYLLSMIDSPKTISQLISGSGLPEDNVLRMLYTLLATGVLDPLEEVIDIKTSVKLANASGSAIRPVPVSAPTASSPRASGAYRKLSPLDQTYNTLQAATGPLKMPVAQPVAQPAFQAQAAQAQVIETSQPSPAPVVKPQEQPKPSNTKKINTAKLEALAGVKIRSSSGAKAGEVNEQAEQAFVQGKQLLRTSDIRRAEISFRQAVEISPDTPKYLLALALLLVKRGSRKDAEGLLIRCCELEPTAIEPRLQLAGIYEQSGLNEKAEQLYKSVLNIDPEHPVATEKLKKESTSIWNADVGSLFSKILKK